MPKLVLAALVALAAAGGCARSSSIGTQGTLRRGDEPLANVRVTVNRLRNDVIESMGFGVTDEGGTFFLVTGLAGRGLRLAPGNYVFTLKSVGGQLRIPNEYAQVNLTPLKVTWPGGDQILDLEVALHPKQAAIAK